MANSKKENTNHWTLEHNEKCETTRVEERRSQLISRRLV